MLVLSPPGSLPRGELKTNHRATRPTVVHQFTVLHEPVLMRSAVLVAFAIRYRVDHQVVTGKKSYDNSRTWGEARKLTTLPREGAIFGYYKAFVDFAGEICRIVPKVCRISCRWALIKVAHYLSVAFV